MKKTNILLGTTLLASLTLPDIKAESQINENSDKPNVLFIFLDDMNGYGVMDKYSHVISPNIKKLRNESINFTASSCASPVSTASRVAMFSGLYPHNTGMYLNGVDAWIQNPELSDKSKTQTLFETFKKGGYETWGRGKIFHTKLTSGRLEANFDNRPIYMGGFGPFYDSDKYPGGTKFFSIKPWDNAKDGEHPDNINTEAAIEYLKQDHEKPFILYLGLWKPHCPYTAPERFFDLYDGVDFPLPDGYKEDDLDDVPLKGRDLVDSLKRFKFDPDKKGGDKVLKDFLKAYCANVSFADWNVGRVLDALEKSKYNENTIIIFASDNGYQCSEKLRWEKATLWEASAYVPFIVNLPENLNLPGVTKKIKRIKTCDTPVSLVDIYPSLVELCSLGSPTQELDGISIIDVLSGNQKGRKVVTSYGAKYSSIRSERYRLLTYSDGTQELYDLKKDVYEWNNLASDPKYKKVIEELSTYIPTEWAECLGGRLEVPRKKNNFEK